METPRSSSGVVGQHMMLQSAFGLFLGALQFLELGVNLPFSMSLVDTIWLCGSGFALGVVLNLLLASCCLPLILLKRQGELADTLSLGWLLTGLTHLGVLLLPFAWMKWNFEQPALAGIIVVVWLLMGVLLQTNGRFWLRRLLRDHGHLRHLYGTLISVTMVLASIGVVSFQNRGYGASNAILSDPDVMVVSLDGIGTNALSRYSSDSFANTPNLDSLASQCIDFSEAVSVSTEVFPAHVAMFTGRYPGQLNIVDDQGLLKYASATLAEKFVKEGYATALFANHPHLDMKQGFAQGMQRIDVDQPLDVLGFRVKGAGQYRTGEWLQQWQGAEPNPLDPLIQAGKFLNTYQDKPVFLWVQSQVPNFLEPQEYRKHVEQIDAQVGDFVRMLDTRKVDRERLLIVTSAFGNHFDYGKSDHRGIAESVIRVPLIICPLKAQPHSPKPFEGQVRTVDIPNTVYAQVGFTHNKEISSVDISDRQKDHVVYQTVLMGHDPEHEGGFQLGYRFQASNSDTIYKYKWFTHRKLQGIYNLMNDPTELDNIVSKAPQMRSDLSNALTTAASSIPALKVTPNLSHPETFQPIP